MFNIRFEKVSDIYYRVFMELQNIRIRLDVEETESYISFFITHNTPCGVVNYYALSDYSFISGVKKKVFVNELEENDFKKKIRESVRNRKKIFSSDKNGDQIVYCIYSFLNTFVKKLRS